MSALEYALPPGRRLAELSASEQNTLLQRGRALDPAVNASVSGIIADVRARGDAALLDYAREFDRVDLRDLEVPRSLCTRALERLEPPVHEALLAAAAAIRAFHSAQLPVTAELEVRRGVRLIRRAEPLRSVGVYAPGGRAVYPSSVLMGVLPARVAGVGTVVLCSPPGPNGLPPDAVLAAAALAGVDRVFAVGGAGAIAALAVGTATIARVDKIVGPGNAYVSEAKRQLTGEVAIDSPAGPSEILILADDSADAELIVLELMAQAEHDPDAAAVLVATSAELVERCRRALEREVARAPRGEIIRQSLAANGALLLASDDAELTDFAARYAPEHLLVLTRAPRVLLPDLRAAGSIFLGAGSSVAFGDYLTGANHVLPTAGLARAYAGLSTADFVRWSTIQEIDDAGARALSAHTALLADIEGLPAHAAAARARAGSGKAGASAGPVLREAYSAIELYDPRRAPCAIDLSDNTNLFGVAPAARRILSELADARITRYPGVFADRLKEALADWHGVAPENVTTGCGSDDVIDSALRAFCERGDDVAYPSPTFSMVTAFSELNALRPVAVPLPVDLTLPVDQLVAAGARVTYVCRPNNPTGTVFERSAIDQLAASMAGILLLDEAYADFAENQAPFAVDSDRVVSLRTMSKAFGLAGLRIGYALGPARLIREIEKSRGPYKINGIAEAVAGAVLAEDRDWVKDIVAQTRAGRSQLAQALERLDYRPLASGGNFLCVPVKAGQSASALAASLRNRGVAIRPFPALSGLGDCIRVTIGPWSMMERFLEELSAV